MSKPTPYTINPYRYAENEVRYIYARVRHDADGTPNTIESRINVRGGASHWRRVWRKGGPMSRYCERVMRDLR